jgi:hypothetical protein
MTRRRGYSPDAHDKLSQAIADRLKQPIDSEVVAHVTLLHLQREALKGQLLQGGHVLTSDIVALDNALDKYVPRPGLEVVVRFTDPADVAPPGAPSVCGVAACRRCGWAPPNNDQTSVCYRCSWVVGADVEHLPRRPLASLGALTPAAEQAQVEGENVVAPLRRAPQLSDEDAKLNRMAELKHQARADRDGFVPPPQAPRINYNSGDGGSISDLMRRINNSYI